MSASEGQSYEAQKPAQTTFLVELFPWGRSWRSSNPEQGSFAALSTNPNSGECSTFDPARDARHPEPGTATPRGARYWMTRRVRTLAPSMPSATNSMFPPRRLMC